MINLPAALEELRLTRDLIDCYRADAQRAADVWAARVARMDELVWRLEEEGE